MKIAVLGSSLMSVFEAIHQARLGNAVTIIDKDTKIGGAWQLGSSLGHNDVEIGCHILVPNGENDVDKRIYNLIEKFTNTRLSKLSSQPLNVRSRSIPEAEMKKFDFYYPENGFPELLDNLEKVMKDSSVEYLHSHFVKDITLTNDNLAIISTDQGDYTFDKVMFPSYFGVDKININYNDEIDIPFEKRVAKHAVIKVSHNLNKFTYCQIHDEDNVIDLVSRVSDYTSDLDSSKYDLLCARISRSHKEKHESFDLSIARLVFENLIDRDLISKESEFEDYSFHNYTTFYRDATKLELVEAIQHPSFQHLNTGALIRSSAQYVDHWGNELSQV